MGKRLRKPVKKQLDFTEKIIKILTQNSNKSFNYKQIAAKLELDDTQSRNQIIKDLKILTAQKQITESEPGKYLIVESSKDYSEGEIDMTGRKTAYFVSPDFEDDVFIFELGSSTEVLFFAGIFIAIRGHLLVDFELEKLMFLLSLAFVLKKITKSVSVAMFASE